MRSNSPSADTTRESLGFFAGDGSVVLFPPQHADAARLALARVRGFAAREHRLVLRAGVATVATLRRFGSDGGYTSAARTMKALARAATAGGT